MIQDHKKHGGLLVVLFVLSLFMGKSIGDRVFHSETKASSTSHVTNTQWTCSMHPQIKKDKQGKCPVCAMDLIPVQTESAPKKRKIKYWQAPMDPGYQRDKPGKSPMGMDLVPVYEDVSDGTLAELKLSKNAEKLADIQVTPVVRDFAIETLLLSGKLVVDETRTKTISAWFPGRIENLFIDYTGIKVQKQDHMAVIYSPDLLVAQKELLEAKRSGAGPLIQSTREKLRLWGLSNHQIKSIEKTGRVSDKLTINAPIGGTVLKKHVSEGDYVKTGSKIYQIADLSRLWLSAEVYESSVGKIHYGQKLSFTTDAYPSESFDGIVTFVDPVVEPETRIIRVRAVVDNKNQKLKPEMLTRIKINVKMGKNGVVNTLKTQALWVGPMHQEEVSDKPGKCSICGMKLRKASELGLIGKTDMAKPLLIPATAPLITGKRAVVYIKTSEPGIYEGREIGLGPRVGDYYIVHHGLKEGELIVSRGNFKIDSAMQIQAKPSMMQSENTKVMQGHNH
ncbi:MAG: efflux RND transporter periplasmic adaptor subunit [Desulfobacteraceae bacterium]|nr:efflux RND transporter periplasmic adaptor subunit [Desulfobacteraceae bacterium]